MFSENCLGRGKEVTMKGLLVKDFKLLMLQKNNFLFIILTSIGILIFTDALLFMIGFIPFILSIFSLTSISYDEYNNGNAFLFSLPVSRKNYAVEKYLFAIIITIGGWIISTFIVLGAGSIINENLIDILMYSFTVLSIILINTSVILPFQLKFGGEIGRIVMMITFGVLFLLVIIVLKIVEFFHIDLHPLINSLSAINVEMIIGAVGIAVVAILFISMKISINIVNKKEF